ncbi:Os02g0184450 [Oryza sativa Japonica Group]|uniref:Os02g0184450 protein n=1 Tax=Oryza sativa subsp. japonica TaxID=39947 RepID=A0A0P0VFL0_ORYSJ|nr:hypothetical protein EE612_009335 [Oryza sativa]BAS77335.1 Os02g0184450 [Oryza sativa Japonica Group]
MLATTARQLVLMPKALRCNIYFPNNLEIVVQGEENVYTHNHTRHITAIAVSTTLNSCPKLPCKYNLKTIIQVPLLFYLLSSASNNNFRCIKR